MVPQPRADRGEQTARLERRLPRPRAEYERMLAELNDALRGITGETPVSG